jgi:hypothetical protein
MSHDDELDKTIEQSRRTLLKNLICSGTEWKIFLIISLSEILSLRAHSWFVMVAAQRVKSSIHSPTLNWISPMSRWSLSVLASLIWSPHKRMSWITSQASVVDSWRVSLVCISSGIVCTIVRPWHCDLHGNHRCWARWRPRVPPFVGSRTSQMTTHGSVCAWGRGTKFPLKYSWSSAQWWRHA